MKNTNSNKEMIDHHPDLHQLYNEAIILLCKLIATPSFSGEEHQTGNIIEQFLKRHGVKTYRKYNNIWAYNKHYALGKPTLLLNSHHDTVKPNAHYNIDPFNALIYDDKVHGLGSNDAGASLVSLLSTFIFFYEDENLPINICMAATGEEENSGDNGIKSILNDLGQIDFAVVGQPTGMQIATAEQGSMAIDCVVKGISGHAARIDGDNAIYNAIKEISWFSTFQFPPKESITPPVKMMVTQINGGVQHNVIPSSCAFTVDIRFDYHYTPKEILDTIINYTNSNFKVRPNISYPSYIADTHPLVIAGIALGRKTYRSPISSDQGWLINLPSIKLGPGEPMRSHTANEFVLIDEIEEGITIYTRLLHTLFKLYEK